MARRDVRKGFTLLELVVTLSVIIVLVSILFVSIAKVRDQANRVQCVTNMRTLAAAVRLYAMDYQDAVVSANSDAGRSFDQGWLYTWISWRNPNEPVGATPIPAGFFAPGRVTISPNVAWNLVATFKTDRNNPYVMEQVVRRGDVWPYVRNYKFYLCPSEKPPYTLTAAQQALVMACAGGRSDNQFPVNSGNVWVTPDDYFSARYISAYKMNVKVSSDMKRLSQAHRTSTFLFWESDETIFDVGGWASWNDGGNDGAGQGLTPRHGEKGATIALLDGSAEYILRAKFQSPSMTVRFKPMP